MRVGFDTGQKVAGNTTTSATKEPADMPKDVFTPSPTAEFIVTYCNAIDCAARILGGIAAQKRFRRLIDDATICSQITRRMQSELDALEDLLSLRHVHEGESIEATSTGVFRARCAISAEAATVLPNVVVAASTPLSCLIDALKARSCC
jgi:hypothetical protein